jgi:hypothetical protein
MKDRSTILWRISLVSFHLVREPCEGLLGKTNATSMKRRCMVPPKSLSSIWSRTLFGLVIQILTGKSLVKCETAMLTNRTERTKQYPASRSTNVHTPSAQESNGLAVRMICSDTKGQSIPPAFKVLGLRDTSVWQILVTELSSGRV